LGEGQDGGVLVMMLGLSLAMSQPRGAPSPPQLLVAPLISGGSVAGGTLTAYDGAFSGSPVITRRWLLDATASGTGTTLATASGDSGKVPTLEVTATANGRSTVVTVSRSALVTEASIKTEFVSTLTAAGITAKLDAAYCFASSTAALGKVNLLNAGTNDAVAVGTAPTHTPFVGFRSAASGSYLTSINPTLGGFQFTQDSHCLGIWCVTDVASNNAAAGWDNVLINPRVSPDIYRTRAASASATNDNVTGEVDARGLSLVSRRASTEYYKYRNGECSKVSNGKVTQTSAALTSAAVRFLAWGDSSPSNLYDTTRTHAFGVIGGGLTEAEMLTLYQAAGLMLTKLGAVAPEVSRLQCFYGDTPAEMRFAADVKWAFETGLKTRIMVSAAADTTFAAPSWVATDTTLTKTGIYAPFKHTATGLAAATAYIAQAQVVRP
jgi:hypothetical protein